MKNQILVNVGLTLAIAAVCVTLSGCGWAQNYQTRQRVLADPHLRADVREAIRAEKIKIGMTQNEVIASWGHPCWYCSGTRENSWGDTWEYNPFGSGRYSAGSGTYLFFDQAGLLRTWSK